MGHKDLSNFGKLFSEFKTAILSDVDIRKMLYYDSPDALSREAPSIETVSSYIFNAPLVESGIEDFGRNTYIMIDLARIDTDTEDEDPSKDIIAVFAITPVTTFTNWMLDDNKIRILEMTTRIINKIDNHKFSPSGKAYIPNIERTIISKQLFGYYIRVVITDNQVQEEF